MRVRDAHVGMEEPRLTRWRSGTHPRRLAAFIALVTGLAACVAPGAPVAIAQTPPTPAIVAAGTPSPGSGNADVALYAAVLPDQRDGVYQETNGHLSRYKLHATFTPASGDQRATIVGKLALLYVNDTGQEQPDLYFRLYPNGAEYAEGGMTLADATAGGRPVTPELSVADTVARVALPVPVAAGGTIEVRLSFTTTIPTDPTKSYGMFAFNRLSGTYALAHWEPLLAGYDPVTGWNLAPPSVIGDPVFTNAGLWDVTVTAPSELVFATTGTQVGEKKTGGQTRHHFVSGPVRDFVMAASANYQAESVQVGGTTVTSYFNPNDARGGKAVLVDGAQALEVYNRLFGTYPYTELDLAEVHLGNGAGGVEFPQLVFMGADFYGDSAATRVIPRFLEFIVAHEVAHQWWYGLVGNDQYVHAFLDEGLVNHSTTVYFERQYGSDVGQQQGDFNLKLPYFTMLFGGNGDHIVDWPTDNFPSQNDYSSTIYGKAALGFGAIRQKIGTDAYLAALKDYAARMRFKVATPDDLKTAFEQASGQDLSELWRHWFQAAEGRQDYTPDDFSRLIQELKR